jgi:hypothetical protein
MADWPEDRPESYDPDLVWDEGTESWISVDARGGSRYQVQIVVVSDQGKIYFGST